VPSRTYATSLPKHIRQTSQSGFRASVPKRKVASLLFYTVGTIIPMFFKRIRIDPAVATGPFVTTAIDIIGVFTYFLLAKIFLFGELV
jgi:cation transporter-like permease